jgi:3-oxoacyl-(acyl-carrier-protein) synthase
MNITTEPLITSTQDQVKAIQTMATFGCSGVDRFAQFNVYAGLAALDNSTHHYTMLVRSKSFDELIALQMRSLLPAVESAKAYIRQVFMCAALVNREFDHVIASEMSRVQDKVDDNMYYGLTDAEENGILAVKIIKTTIKSTWEAALSSQDSFKKAVYDSLNLPDIKGEDDVTDVIAKPPKRAMPLTSLVGHH